MNIASLNLPKFNIIRKVNFASNPINFRGIVSNIEIGDTFELQNTCSKEPKEDKYSPQYDDSKEIERVQGIIQENEKEEAKLYEQERKLRILEVLLERILNAQNKTTPKEEEPKSLIEDCDKLLGKIEEYGNSDGKFNQLEEAVKTIKELIGKENKSAKELDKAFEILLKEKNNIGPKRSKAYRDQCELCGLNNNYRTYLKKYKECKPFSFLYNPELSEEEIKELSKEKGTLKSDNLARELDIHPKTMELWCKYGAFDETISTSETEYLINTRTKKASDFIDKVKQNKDSYLSVTGFMLKYNVPESSIGKFVKKLDFVGIDAEKFSELTHHGILVDTTSEKTLKTIEEIKKLYPQKSEYFNRTEVSAAYLAKLGLGDFKTICKMVNDYSLDGRVVLNKKGQKITLVDIKTRDNEYKLKTLRKKTGRLKEVTELARQLKIPRHRIEEALINGEAEIIPEYIFISDWNKYFIDTRSPKNEEFISKILLEKQVEKEIRAKKRQEEAEARIQNLPVTSKVQSLKMALVWSYCDKTKEKASEIAKQDGFICKLLEKEAEAKNGGEELTSKEIAKLNSFRKKVWTTIGTEEFKEGFKKAKLALNEYAIGGIEAVSDPRAADIIRQYTNN